jgi:hypothetical protein
VCLAVPKHYGLHLSQGKLAATATQMGAIIKLDLTSDVTHLIVGSTDSAKYRYVAKCREDVKVLAPEWIEALRNVWLRGEDDTDVVGLEEEYRLPTFFGLRICLTGFDNRTNDILFSHKCADRPQRNSGAIYRRRWTRTGLNTTVT